MKNDIGHYAKIEKLLEQMEEKESERYSYLLGATKVEFKDRQPWIDKATEIEESRNEDKNKLLAILEKIDKIYNLIYEDISSENNEEQYCWNCEYFSAPYGCSNIFGFATPFDCCNDWSEADEEDIEENKDKIDECCKENKIKRINKYKGNIRAYKRAIDTDFRQILALLDMEDEDEKRIKTCNEENVR